MCYATLLLYRSGQLVKQLIMFILDSGLDLFHLGVLQHEQLSDSGHLSLSLFFYVYYFQNIMQGAMINLKHI